MSNSIANSPKVASPVRITSAPGTIWISSSSDLSGCDESTYRRFIERVLTVDAVRSIDVNRNSGDFVVQYDRRMLRQGEAMTRISGALNRAPDAQVAGIDLDLIAGRVTRVERRPWGTGAVTTIVSTGSDFLAACSRVLRRQSLPDPADRGPRDPAEAIVVEHGLAIHFVPGPLVMSDVEQLANLTPSAEQPGNAGMEVAPARPPVVVATGFMRILNLTAAGGCFVMSFVGLVTPGIPTVPFVLATSYFLVRSSPSLNERLRKSRFFGQMVRDWEEHGGLRRSTKRRILLFTFGIMAVTLVIAEVTLPLLAVIAVMGTLGVVLVARLPTVNVESVPAEGLKRLE